MTTSSIDAYACGTPIRKHIPQAAAESTGGKLYPESDPEYRGGDAIVWGLIRGAPELIKKIREAGSDYWHMDNGYFGRNHYYRITRNANQVTDLKESKPDRWEFISKKFGLRIEPWKKGSHIIVALSTPWLYKFYGTSGEKWLEETITTLRKHTDRKIIIRQKTAKMPIEQELKGAHALVTYTSCAALDALRAGVPVFTNGECCARPLSQKLKRIEHPKKPPREPLFWYLATQMFTKEELRSGMWLSSGGM